MAGFYPRQTALFGDAWFAGYAAALEGVRIDTLTLGAWTEERGLADVSDRMYRRAKRARAHSSRGGQSD
ncbi:conserved hypothetical protein [Paraburkholderia atlantica]|uniref:D-apionate lactonase TIM barrel domain-containing protein n=1 Tax=Paraburkholderia atlantica TaxID=2654982 RepID=D5WKP6_PARAM|nr:hypothetical protein [Paraburkholderia atlantica]ADG19792.1 conserved hypothetical protein [Paraburkholderia atlantica]